MPIRYARSDRHKLAVIVIIGPFYPADLFACIEHHRADGGWNYGVLYDLRQMTEHPTNEALREFASTIAGPPGDEAVGPVAILTHDPVLYTRIAKKYATMEVFLDEEDAEAWLSRSA
jgi:hypothetical protein